MWTLYLAPKCCSSLVYSVVLCFVRIMYPSVTVVVTLHVIFIFITQVQVIPGTLMKGLPKFFQGQCPLLRMDVESWYTWLMFLPCSHRVRSRSYSVTMVSGSFGYTQPMSCIPLATKLLLLLLLVAVVAVDPGSQIQGI